MKRRLGMVILTAVLLLLAVSAAFAAELTWNQGCRKKTNSPTTIYVRLNEDSNELTPTSSLPAGSYIKTTGQEIDGKAYVAYSLDNNNALYGYIDKNVIVSAVASYTLSDGRVVKVPEAVLRSKAALDLYLDMEYGVTSGDSTTYTDENGNVIPIGNESAANSPGEGGNDAAWAVGMARAAAANGSYTPTYYTDPEGNTTEVSVVYMGLARSMIVLDGKKVMVETHTLRWDTEAPENKVLAVVTAKNYARLRAKTSSKSLVMDKCYAGQVMRVLGTGKTWTFVDYRGIRGYVLTSSLSFHKNEPREYRTGWVATKSGHTYGNSTVHVRNTPTGKQREEYPVGTPITIFEDDGKWCHIEVEGHNCYIKSEFVLVDSGEKAESTP